MKKVLALVLVAVLAIGMGMSSFGAASIKGFAKDNNGRSYTLADGVYLDEIEGADHPDTASPKWSQSSNDTQVLDLGRVYAMDEAVVYVNLTTTMFGLNNLSVGNTNATYYATLDTTKFGTHESIFFTPQNARPDTWNAVYVMLDQAGRYDRSGKEITSANMNAATSTQVSQLSNRFSGTQAQRRTTALNTYARPDATTLTSVYDAWVTAYDNLGLVNWVESSNTSGLLYFTTVNGAVYSDDFLNSTYNRNLTSDEIRSNKISFNTTLKANSNTIKDIQLQNDKGRIRFRAVDEWVSTTDKDFEAVIYLIIDGKRFDSQHVTIIGNMYNPELEVYADHDSVDISKGYIAVPVEFNQKIAVYVGNGATIHTKMFKDKKYYGITTRDDDEDAEIVFRQYKDVDNVLTFKVVGINNTDAYVTLNTDYASYYVYDKDMNYLGRGDEQLDFSTKFYLANSRLDIDSDEDPDEEYDRPSADNPDTGGDGAAANNVNANPGTGR